jgi:hypothetical protein
LKGELQKDMNLFMKNMKPCVSYDKGENISNGIMGRRKNVDHKCNESTRVRGWGRLNLVCNATKDKNLMPNGKME